MSLVRFCIRFFVSYLLSQNRQVGDLETWPYIIEFEIFSALFSLVIGSSILLVLGILITEFMYKNHLKKWKKWEVIANISSFLLVLFILPLLLFHANES